MTSTTSLSPALRAMGAPGRPPVPPLDLVGNRGGGPLCLVASLPAVAGAARETSRGEAVAAAIIPPRFGKPWVKSSNSDTIDAEAIAEAVTLAAMRGVRVRTGARVDLQAPRRLGDRPIRSRTGPMNRARAFCIETGLAMHTGGGGFHADIRRPHAGQDARDPVFAICSSLQRLLFIVCLLARRTA